MHTNKNRFTLQKDLIHTVSQLPNDKAGELFKYILAFVNHQEPTSDDIVIKLAFEPIKHDLLRDCSIRKSRAIARKIVKQNVSNDNKTEQNVSNDNKTEQNVSNSNKIVGPKKETIDYQEIIDIFNNVCKSLPHAYVTDDRKRKINTLLKTYTLDQIGIVFIKTSQSNYLTGKTVQWKANLSWILKPDNFIRILEGTFDNHNYNKNLSETAEKQWHDINDAVDKLYDNE